MVAKENREEKERAKHKIFSQISNMFYSLHRALIYRETYALSEGCL